MLSIQYECNAPNSLKGDQSSAVYYWVSHELHHGLGDDLGLRTWGTKGNNHRRPPGVGAVAGSGLGVFNEQRLPNPCWLMICLGSSGFFSAITKNKNAGIFLIRDLGISLVATGKSACRSMDRFVPGAFGGWVSELLLLRQLGVQGLDAPCLDGATRCDR